MILVAGASRDFTGVAKSVKATEFWVGEQIADVEFTDLNGTTQRLSDLQSARAIVIAMHRHDCPLSQKYSPALKAVIEDFKAESVEFLIVNTDSFASTEVLKQASKHYQFGIPYLPDFESRMAKALNAQTTTEVFVLDRARTLRYRGPIDDQHGIGTSLPAPKQPLLRKALEAVLQDREVEEKAFESPGCLLGLQIDSEDLSQVTFHTRVSRILQTNCQTCHRPQGVAPFSLISYQDAVGHGSMIQWMVNSGAMPPWFAHPSVGVWKNDRRLTARDKRALFHWLKNNHPEGDPKEAPLTRVWPEGWNIGKPDLILTTDKAYSIPASGVLPYEYTTILHGLTEDKWVKAIEIRPTHPAVVHHVIALVKEQGENAPEEVTGFFGVYVPGQTFVIYPDSLGRKLTKSSKIFLQIHYTPNGTAVEDRPEIGIVYHKNPPQRELDAHSCYTYNFAIPPHDPNYEVKATRSFEKRTRIFSFLPHMHLRGKAFRVELEFPDGTIERVLEVPKYDFNWQLLYELRQPIDVPAGTKMNCTAWYDNSEGNPYNPDPDSEVKYGEQTSEEMMFGFFESTALEP